MKRHTARIFIVMLAALFMGITVFEVTAEARGGGGRSSGSRGSRTYTKPAAPSSQSNQQRQQQQAAPAPNQMQQQPMGGSFLRSMAGGLMGGMIGSMLFSSFAGASGGMGGSGGIGLFEIILLAGGAYLLYRFIAKKRAESQPVSGFQRDIPVDSSPVQTALAPANADPVSTGLDHIRQMDAGFDSARFSETAMDIFFKIQAGWMNRDLSKVTGLMTDEMRTILQGDVDELLRNKRINRLENIAVRNVELAEVWQESGQDFITTSIHANLLDYTTDETGAVLEGSTTDPVVFKEFWTFSRPVGNNSWQLSAIHQS